MASNNSYHTVAEQVINFNNNVVDLLSKINKLVSSSDPTVTINITDGSGIARQFNLPSFGFLKSEIDRLNNNINSIYNINDGGALIQPTNGTKFKKIVTVDLNIEPNDVNNLGIISTFKNKKNWFFDSLLNPQLFIELDLSGQIENNVRKIICRRYIPEFAQDTSGNLTPLGQSALNSFNNLYRNKNTFTLEEFETWHQNTPGLIEPLNPNYDEQAFDLEPNRLEYDGLFTVLKIEEDTLNKKLWYHVDTLNYNRNSGKDETVEVRQLSINDEMIINTPLSTTRYKIVEISTSSSNPRLRFERVEGNEPIPVGISTLKIYSPVIYNKKVSISVGYNERNVIFIKSLNMDNYILSKNWSKGMGYWTNDLKESNSGLSMEQFYIDTVYDYGDVLHDLVAKKTPNKLAGVPNTVTLNSENFKVVQINKHLTDTPDSNSIKIKHNQQKKLKSEVEQIMAAIGVKNIQLRVTRFTSESERNQFTNELNLLHKNKDSKGKLLSSITNEILDLSKSVTIKANPIFHVRGFFEIPEAVITRGTKPQEVIQFRIQYRYLSKDGKESPVETFNIIDNTLSNIQKSGAFSNWIEFKTDARKRTFNSVTGQYTWEIEDLSDANTPNINQIDIPIKYGEKIEIKIKSISEVGWPDSPVESDWSEILSIEFPDDLNNVLNENDFILKEASKEDLRVTVQNDLSAKGLDEHLSEQLTVNNVTYHHSSDKILSGFKDDNGNAIDLFQYLSKLENRIKSLEEKIKRVKGELEVVIFRNSEEFIIKNGSDITFNIECEDYLDNFSGSGVPTGRVYANNIYVIKDFLMKIKNKSSETPLGLLSNRVYSINTNSDVFNSASPQTFWVDQQNELISDNSSGVTKTQKDNQFIWMVNYDNVNQNVISKLSENIGNNFVSLSNNSLSNILSSSEFNIGYASNNILSFVGNNMSLLDPSKWIDITSSVASTTKLLTSVHPQIQGLDKIQETNVDKIKTIDGGVENDINIPINIYFKMNALDSSQSGLNYQYINLNSSKSTVRHNKKLKFLLENEVDNRPFIFTVNFVINRSKVVVKKSLVTSPTQLISNR
jgi:hypothetical protein